MLIDLMIESFWKQKSQHWHRIDKSHNQGGSLLIKINLVCCVKYASWLCQSRILLIHIVLFVITCYPPYSIEYNISDCKLHTVNDEESD